MQRANRSELFFGRRGNPQNMNIRFILVTGKREQDLNNTLEEAVIIKVNPLTGNLAEN